MRLIGPWTLALLALAAPGWSGDIYRWTDGGGNVHYSNMDAEGDDAAAVAHEPAAEEAPADLTDDTTDEAADRTAARGDADTFSATASLRRSALERDLRATARRLHEIDARLSTLARARGQHAQGSAATGGVAAPTAPEGIDLRSEEERTLATEREQLVQRADQVRSDAAKLREEVTARLGATPPWWIDLR